MIKIIGGLLFVLGCFIVSYDCLQMAAGREADTSLAMLLHASKVLEMPEWQIPIMWLAPMLAGFLGIIIPTRQRVRG
jgi:hypothetical protein